MFPNDFEDAISYAFQAMTMGNLIVFYGQQVYGEYPSLLDIDHRELPDGAYIYNPHDKMGKHWYRTDLTPVLPCDIPPEVRVNCLLLGIPV